MEPSFDEDMAAPAPVAMNNHTITNTSINRPHERLGINQPTSREEDDWTKRTETTALKQRTDPAHPTSSESSGCLSASSTPATLNDHDSNESDPRGSISSPPVTVEQMPAILRHFFHDYTITQALGLPYLPIPIIDLISDCMYPYAPVTGSCGFQFMHYYLPEIKPQLVKLNDPSRTLKDSDYFSAAFPFNRKFVGTSAFLEIGHSLEMIGEREERGEGIGDRIDLGDGRVHRRVWVIFGQKCSDEIRLEDYRHLSISEQTDSTPIVDGVDEWNNSIFPLQSVHWCFDVESRSFTSFFWDDNGQMIFDLEFRAKPSKFMQSSGLRQLYSPTITQSEDTKCVNNTAAAAATHIIDSPYMYTAFSDNNIIYSFQLSLPDNRDQLSRIFYFGFGDPTPRPSPPQFVGSIAVAGFGLFLEMIYQPTERAWKCRTSHQTTHTWINSTLMQPTQLHTPILIPTSSTSTLTPILSCQYSSTNLDSGSAATFRWLVDGKVIFETQASARYRSPKIYVTSGILIQLKHQPGPNPRPDPSFFYGHFPINFDEAHREQERLAAPKPLFQLPINPPPQPQQAAIPFDFSKLSLSFGAPIITDNSTTTPVSSFSLAAWSGPFGSATATSSSSNLSSFTFSPTIPPSQPSTPNTATPTNAEPPTTMSFRQAMEYIAKIRARFQDRSEIYSQFLDMLHDHQKQKISPPEISARIRQLFAGHSDLIEELEGSLSQSSDPTFVKAFSREVASDRAANEASFTSNLSSSTPTPVPTLPLPNSGASTSGHELTPPTTTTAISTAPSSLATSLVSNGATIASPNDGSSANSNESIGHTSLQSSTPAPFIFPSFIPPSSTSSSSSTTTADPNSSSASRPPQPIVRGMCFAGKGGVVYKRA